MAFQPSQSVSFEWNLFKLRYFRDLPILLSIQLYKECILLKWLWIFYTVLLLPLTLSLVHYFVTIIFYFSWFYSFPVPVERFRCQYNYGLVLNAGACWEPFCGIGGGYFIDALRNTLWTCWGIFYWHAAGCFIDLLRNELLMCWGMFYWIVEGCFTDLLRDILLTCWGIYYWLLLFL